MSFLGFIYSILPSLTATLIGALGAWFYNKKRQSDKVANEIESLRNEINSVRNDMNSGFNGVNLRIDRVKLDKDILSHEFSKFTSELTSEQEGLITEVNKMIKDSELEMFKTVSNFFNASRNMVDL